MKTWKYRGCNITKSSVVGYALPYSSYVNNHFVSASSLEMMKLLIRNELSGVAK